MARENLYICKKIRRFVGNNKGKIKH